MIRVLVLDDHPLFRDGLVGLLDVIEDMSVAGVVGAGEEAVSCALELRPDVVLTDLDLPTGWRPPGGSSRRPRAWRAWRR